MPPRKGPVTRVRMVDVASEAGVSQATASRVLNHDPRVAAAAREAVLAAAARLGYTVNPAARSLASARTRSIGFVVAEPSSHLWGNPYFPRLFAGVTEALAERDHQLVLFMPQTEADLSRLQRYLAQGHVDGVLHVTSRRDDPLLRHLVAGGTPVVAGGRPVGVPEASYVDVDNQAAGDIATTHLHARGYRRIGTVAGPQDTAAGADRLQGYLDACRRLGLEPLVAPSPDFSFQSGWDGARRLADEHEDLDALFVPGDLMCLGALAALGARGLRVPDDVGLVGFDDSAPAATTDPPLTSVAQPVEELGHEMVRILFDRLGDRRTPQVRVVLGTHLVERASSRGPARYS
ncbi:MAG TPA: LacI family DNA-binding transcriptional regulator [Kineosporiaceae bacterium]|nr:LacI family DNA-binding transcriptional regulator [Kineosporiaceae bacterium]